MINQSFIGAAVARPLSEEKQDAILSAATRIIAIEGVGVATARIAKEAGVATGSLFTYYPTKDALLNGLYLALKQEVAEALLSRYPEAGSPRERARHVWDLYIRWALENPAKRRAMDQLSLSHRLTPETVATASAGLGAISLMAADCLSPSSGMTSQVAARMMIALIGVTIDLAERDPERTADYMGNGFDACWRAISQ